jgi:DNA invertase Pin-like site-specific DNA recombinase
MSCLIGYGRTSTTDQVSGLEAQLRDLEDAGCVKIFSEQVSSVSKGRDRLEACLDYVREGDILVVTKIDRLARSVSDLVRIVELLQRKRVELRVLSLNLDTATPTGKLMLNLMGAIAEFERELMLERQREGILKARLAGRYKGRKPTAISRSAEIVALKNTGVRPEQISKRLGISKSSVYRALKLSHHQGQLNDAVRLRALLPEQKSTFPE